MSKREASCDLVQDKIKKCAKRIDGWSMQIEDLRMEIEKLNRWINFEQSDMDEAGEMLNNMQELEQCHGD
jgi:DNA repair ATPase RecN